MMSNNLIFPHHNAMIASTTYATTVMTTTTTPRQWRRPSWRRSQHQNCNNKNSNEFPTLYLRNDDLNTGHDGYSGINKRCSSNKGKDTSNPSWYFATYSAFVKHSRASSNVNVPLLIACTMVFRTTDKIATRFLNIGEKSRQSPMFINISSKNASERASTQESARQLTNL